MDCNCGYSTNSRCFYVSPKPWTIIFPLSEKKPEKGFSSYRKKPFPKFHLSQRTFCAIAKIIPFHFIIVKTLTIVKIIKILWLHMFFFKSRLENVKDVDKILVHNGMILIYLSFSYFVQTRRWFPFPGGINFNCLQFLAVS